MPKQMTADELHVRLESGRVALFDVRGDLEFEAGHIPGAMSAPLGSLNIRVRGVMNPDSCVVVYSASPEDGLAREAAQRLEDLGLRDVHCVDEGLDGWRAHGHFVVPSAGTREFTHGPVIDCRPLVVDRATAYGGAFKEKPLGTESAGG